MGELVEKNESEEFDEASQNSILKVTTSNPEKRPEIFLVT